MKQRLFIEHYIIGRIESDYTENMESVIETNSEKEVKIFQEIRNKLVECIIEIVYSQVYQMIHFYEGIQIT